MLRKIIKSIIPSKGELFFILFEDGALNVHHSAQILVDIINSKDNQESVKL